MGFTLIDDPNRFGYYWRDVRKELRFWGAFSYKERLKFKLVSTHMNSNENVNILKYSLKYYLY